MEQQHKPEHYREHREITIHLKSGDLVPDDADFERRYELLRAHSDQVEPSCLGWLLASMEGIATAINEGDGRQLAWHVKAGLAAVAAYDTIVAERREQYNVANSTVSQDTKTC